MALFGNDRDASLIRHLNRELMHSIVSIDVEVYKVTVADTNYNIYGESGEKRYYDPVRVFAVVTKDDTITINSETGELDNTKTMQFGFLKDDLVDKSLVIDISDVIVWDGGYFQVDNVRESNYWWGRNPSTSIPFQQGEIREHGYAYAILADGHRTSISNLNIVQQRSGINPIISQPNIPKNI